MALGIPYKGRYRERLMTYLRGESAGQAMQLRTPAATGALLTKLPTLRISQSRLGPPPCVFATRLTP